MLLHTVYFMYLFKLEFPPDTCLRMEFLDFLVTVFFLCFYIYLECHKFWLQACMSGQFDCQHSRKKYPDHWVKFNIQRAKSIFMAPKWFIYIKHWKSWISNFIPFYMIILSYYATTHRKKGVFSRRQCLDIFPF